jgi:bifunctional UDP-N-acetylglucosamine pyrophosphorylase / glucosamine-1-phosphate N-acetyltransferase
MLVAPVTLGDRAMTASGLGHHLGCAPRRAGAGAGETSQQAGLAVKLMERLRAIKAARKG